MKKLSVRTMWNAWYGFRGFMTLETADSVWHLCRRYAFFMEHSRRLNVRLAGRLLRVFRFLGVGHGIGFWLMWNTLFVWEKVFWSQLLEDVFYDEKCDPEDFSSWVR